MVEIYLAPVDENNANLSIFKPLSVQWINRILKAENNPSLVIERRFSPKFSRIGAWALSPRKTRQYERIAAGDYVVFSVSGSGRFQYIGCIFDKVKSEKLAYTLWGPEYSDWRNIFIFAGGHDINISKSDLLTSIGYSEGDRLQEFRRLTNKRKDEFMRRFNKYLFYSDK